MLPCDADEASSSVLVRTETMGVKGACHMGEPVSDLDDSAGLERR